MKRETGGPKERQGWMTVGAYIAIGVVILYLVLVIWRGVVPRVRSINQIYHSVE